MPAFIHAPIHMMSWVDFEAMVVPSTPPAPGPFTPYNAIQFMTGIFPGVPVIGSSPLTDAKVMTVLGPPLAKGTDIGMMVPHFGPPNLLLPIILLASSSKNFFGASTVKVGNKPVATALPMNMLGMNLNCGAPVSLPSLVAAPHSVLAGVTLGDILGAIFAMSATMALDAIMSKVGDLPGMGRAKAFIAKKIGWDRVLVRTYKEGLEGMTRPATLAERLGAYKSAKAITEGVAGLVTSKAKGGGAHGLGELTGREGLSSDTKGIGVNLAEDAGYAMAGEDYNVEDSFFGGEKVESQ